MEAISMEQEEVVRELVGLGIFALKVFGATILWSAFNVSTSRLLRRELSEMFRDKQLSVSEIMLLRIGTGISLTSLALVVIALR